MRTEGTLCRIWRRGEPACLLIQPVDARGGEETDREVERIAAGTDIPFLLAAFETEDWNRDLSPWPAAPVFGKEAFGGQAERTLSFVRGTLLPELRGRFGLTEDLPVILGGYSLAGLFALWSAWKTEDFSAVAAASPSVWFPGWIDLAEQTEPFARVVYLSLGDREERTKNHVMATVGDRIRALEKRVKSCPGTECVLEWNEGNHFKDPDRRCARAFCWCMQRLAEREEREE